MKILQIDKFCFRGGGAETYFLNVSDLFTAKGHEVIKWCTKHPKNDSMPYQETFAEYYDLSKREGLLKDVRKFINILWSREANRKLEQLIVKEKPDIAHFQNALSYISASTILTLKKHNVPVVMTLHDYKIFCPVHSFFVRGKICCDCLKEKHFRNCIYKRCMKNSLALSTAAYLESVWNIWVLGIDKKIDHFITPSNFMRERALEWGIPADRVTNIPNFIDVDNLMKRVYNNSENGSKNKEKYFLYAGRLSEEKGVDLLIKAFLKAASKLPGWQLRIAGGGPEEKKLKMIAGETDKVEFLGKLEFSRLKQVTAKAHMVVVPSRWYENFPFAILESFAEGKSVLAANIGGMPELVQNGETGFLFKSDDEDDLADKLIVCAHCPEEKVQRMGEAAQKKALAKCDPESHYNALIKIYERLKGHQNHNH